MPIGNPRWLPPQVIVLTQDHVGKYRNIFFSEAIALIEPNFAGSSGRSFVFFMLIGIPR
jgi:hypothetical protein